MYQHRGNSRSNKVGIKLLLSLMLLAVMLMLTACTGSEPSTLEYKEYALNFLKVEKLDETSLAYAYYESPEEQLYYKTDITSYQYNNWQEVGYPEVIDVLKNEFKYSSFGASYYKAYILSSRDSDKNKTFEDIKDVKVTSDMFTIELDVTEYWGAEAHVKSDVSGNEQSADSSTVDDSGKSAE